MNDQVRAQARPEQTFIDSLDSEFARLYAQLCGIVRETSLTVLYRGPTSSVGSTPGGTPCESLLRSAAMVEQTFGGITANLWDDPFEWTLPETLTTKERILEYLAEVEATRKRAFARFARDSDLLREVAMPSGETRTLAGLLLETLVRATHYHGRTVAALKHL